MKKILFTLYFVFAFALLAFVEVSAREISLDNVISILEKVESNGNPQAIGDNGKAYGILQIHSIMVEDANRIAGTNYKHKDCFNPDISREIARIVLTHYGKQVQKHKGNATIKDLARIWNGGANAWKPCKPSKEKNLENYWKKVYKEYKKKN